MIARNLRQLIDPPVSRWILIAVFERMAAEGSRIVCVPLDSGYVNYSDPMVSGRPVLIKFTDIPDAGIIGPVWLGAGRHRCVAVSAFSRRSQGGGRRFCLLDRLAQISRAGSMPASGGQPQPCGGVDRRHGQSQSTADFYRGPRDAGSRLGAAPGTIAI